jgi:hypothetical protein
VKAVTLANFRPSRRADGLFWAKARIEGADDPAANAWELVDEVALDPLDSMPDSEPQLRSFTLQTDKAWVRLAFVDSQGGEDEPAVVSTSAHPFRPTVAEVAEILRARTYTSGDDDPDPMAVIAGGKLVGTFDETTRPTAQEVERLITRSCRDVAGATGPIPGEMMEEARNVASLKTAAEVERSYIPEQADESRTIYQTLRKSAAEELATLLGNLRVWWFANRGLA